MSQIVHLLVSRITDTLKVDVQEDIEMGDPSRATLVKSYRFQESPLVDNIYAYVTGGSTDDPSLRDARITAKEMEDLGMFVPIGEIGGGHYWWRRGRVKVGCYFVDQKYSQEDAAEYAHIFLGRVMESLDNTQVADLVDEFGERAWLITCHASTFFEGGGPPDQYIWRGDVYWQALTHRVI